MRKTKKQGEKVNAPIICYGLVVLEMSDIWNNLSVDVLLPRRQYY